MIVELAADERGRNQNAQFAAMDCRLRNEESLAKHTAFFKSDDLFDTQADVCELYLEFFGRPNTYVNLRGGRKPFVVMKIDHVGTILNRRAKDKQTQLIDKLDAIAHDHNRRMEYRSKDGHFSVRIY